MAREQKTGIVEKVDFTQGGAGNQWTTIDGVKYATFWAFSNKDWQEGDRVTFEAYETSLWHGHPHIPHARHIHKVDNAGQKPSA